MPEQLTVHEWEAVLLERARPADLLPGETIARYVHRKFAEQAAENEALRKECTRLAEDNRGLLEHPEDAL